MTEPLAMVNRPGPVPTLTVQVEVCLVRLATFKPNWSIKRNPVLRRESLTENTISCLMVVGATIRVALWEGRYPIDMNEH